MTQIQLTNELPEGLVELDMTKKENQDFVFGLIKDAMKDYPNNVIPSDDGIEIRESEKKYGDK